SRGLLCDWGVRHTMKRRRLMMMTPLLAVLLFSANFLLAPRSQESAAGDGEAQNQNAAEPLTLDQLVSGQLKIIDLGCALNENNPYWLADAYEPFRLKTIATLEKNGVLSKAFFCPEHLGTHLDAPNHFEKNQPSVEQIEPANLFAH